MRAFALLLALLLAPLAAPAWESDGQEVDLELVLLVDVSRSMSPSELEIQRRGYAEALRSDEVIAAIRGGMIGRIALSYVEWAGAHAQRTAVPWTLIETRADASAFAGRIQGNATPAMRRTSISGALLFAADSFEENGFSGLRRVIDVSGDGPNNAGRPVRPARDAVLSRGITVNGLPLMADPDSLQFWDIPDLDTYYAECVTGGPGAFVLPVRGWTAFAEAVRRKMVMEIAGDPPPDRLWRAQAEPRAQPYDCLVGEKTWERYRRSWGTP
ncbi:MAG: DUF1194 domain-containing protein [Paracoccaceae bacterium]